MGGMFRLLARSLAQKICCDDSQSCGLNAKSLQIPLALCSSAPTLPSEHSLNASNQAMNTGETLQEEETAMNKNIFTAVNGPRAISRVCRLLDSSQNRRRWRRYMSFSC